MSELVRWRRSSRCKAALYSRIGIRLRAKFARRRLVNDRAWDPGGYTYYVRGRDDIVRHENAFLVGDAAGLATTDLAEGIGPAVQSGIAVADAIARWGRTRSSPYRAPVTAVDAEGPRRTRRST